MCPVFMLVSMSLTEIIDELPRLSHQDRRTLCRRVLELESTQATEEQFLEQSAAESFALLDRMEAEDAARGTQR